jgi:DNA-binding transcriptional MerR regulator
MEKTCLTTRELAERWQIQEQTLRAWRTKGSGPKFFSLNGSIRYSMKDIVTYENESLSSNHHFQGV